MKKILLALALLCCAGSTWAAKKPFKITSPNGTISVTVSVEDSIYYDVAYDGEVLLNHNVLAMQIGDKQLGVNPKLAASKTKAMSELIKPVFPYKFSEINNQYNQLMLSFKGDYSVEFRVFDDGLAYHFITNFPGQVEVMNETFKINLPSDYIAHVQQNVQVKTSCEEFYKHLSPEEWNASTDKYTLLPVLLETKGKKILLCETALSNYPAMFLNPKAGKNSMSSFFTKYPTKFGDDDDRTVKITGEAPYISKTAGKRSFPWRYFVITPDEGKLIENTMTNRLAEPNQLADTKWIKPGVTTWEWWNGACPYGPEIEFVAGCNTATYKYFVDFANKFGVEYILLDEGWAKDTRDPFLPNADLDLQELIRYGNEKNVGVILWLPWLTVENNFSLFEKYEQWGVKGVKIDFMDRGDQWMIDFYERVAKEAASRHLFVDFHGMFHPAGLEIKYPNVLSYEGVRGMEHMGNCIPDNSIYYPFMRNAVGPMDYTPGAMLNYQNKTYRADRPNSGCIGTRAYQMAMFVLWETGLQMMADNPTLYYQNEDCARFMANVPVVTDETRALANKLGEYSFVAKRKGEVWYVGGITNSAEEWRTIELKLDFLPEGKTYRMTSYEDGVNANWQAMHYNKRVKQVKRGDVVTVKLARNGGFAAILE